MLLFFILSAGLIAADQITKALAAAYLKPISTFPIINDVIHLTYHENTGAAFSILRGFRWGFVVLAVAVCGFIIYLNLTKKVESKLFFMGSVLIVAGAIGNAIDRVLTGAVIDFVDFRLINFAVFNLADICLTVGVVILLVYLLFFAGDRKTAAAEGNGAEADADAENNGNG